MKKKFLKQGLAGLLAAGICLTGPGCAAQEMSSGSAQQEEMEAETAEAQAQSSGDTEAQTEAETEAEDLVVCVINGEELYNSRFLNAYQYYVQMFEASGYDTEDENLKTYLTQRAYNAVVEAVLLAQAMEEDGYYSFTEEELDSFAQTGQERWDTYLESYTQYFENNGAEDPQAQAEQYLNSAGFSAESLATSAQESAAIERLYDTLMEGVSFTEEEIEAYYEEQVEADREKYEDDISYFESVRYYTENDIWYIPDGYRHVLQITLDKDDEDLEAKIEDIRSRVQAGESFRTLMEEYTTEEDENGNGYYMHPDSVVWDQDVLDVVFGEDMQQPGDVSQALERDGGVHIFYYLEDREGGAVEFTEELQEYVRQLLEEEEKNERVEDYIEQKSAESVILTMADPSYEA